MLRERSELTGVFSEMNEKKPRILLKIFYILFSIQMFLIIALSFVHPVNGLFTLPLIVYTFISLVLVFAALMVWDRLNSKISISDKCSRIIFYALIACFVVFLFIAAFLHGNHYLVAGDYEFVYLSATELAKGNELTGPLENYFMVFGNNTRSMIILSRLFRLGMILGVREYLPALIRNILLVVGSIISSVYLLSSDDLKKYRVAFIILFAICIPIYSFTPTYYTDSSSIGLGIMALALLMKSVSIDTKKKYLFLVLSVLFTVYGITEKITCIIPVIAGVMVLVYFKKISIKDLLIFAMLSMVLVVCVNAYFSTYKIERLSKGRANPLISWIALGMHGDGSFKDNVEFSETLSDMQTREEKYEYTYEYIEQNIGEAFTPKHIFAKIAYNFGDGTFHASDYLTGSEDDHDLLWDYLHPWGSHYWRGAQYCFVYTSVIYIFIFAGALISLAGLFRGEEVSVIKYTADLSFMGVFIFLLLWESSNRQIYNQLPMIYVAFFESSSLIMKKLNNIKKIQKKVTSGS